MAAKALIPEDEIICSVCLDIFKDPVFLKCSHSVCRACLKHYWEKKRSRKCPICRRKASTGEPPINLVLKNIVESYIKQKTTGGTAENNEVHCHLHGEKLLLFCDQDKEPLCLICLTSRNHKNHSVCPVEEAAQDLKKELKPVLNLIKEKLKRFTEVGREFLETSEHIRSQAQHTERQIKAEFEKLHQFLREEEEARLSVLKEEEREKRGMMEEKIKFITRDIFILTDKITAVERSMETEDASFLKSYKNIRERAQCSLQDPELLSGALIDVAKHLGNLKFRVLEKILETVQYTPVMLDPNTAHASLSLSDDLTTVRDTGLMQECPKNPERFNDCVCVLGSEGFTTGKHIWEVKVGNKTGWNIGVMKESSNRMENILCSPEEGFWVLMLLNGDEYIAPDGTRLKLERKPQSIRVQLDYDRGELSFFNSSDMSVIYTFKDTFTERVFPFFSPPFKDDGTGGPLQIFPVKVSVTVTSSQ